MNDSVASHNDVDNMTTESY